jgi:hypothetical protein
LSVVETFLICNLAHIHVAQLDSQVFIQEDICALEVSVHNVQIMQRFQASHNLDKYSPDCAFIKVGSILLMVKNLLEEITVVRVLHHNAR